MTNAVGTALTGVLMAGGLVRAAVFEFKCVVDLLWCVCVCVKVCTFHIDTLVGWRGAPGCWCVRVVTVNEQHLQLPAFFIRLDLGTHRVSCTHTDESR